MADRVGVLFVHGIGEQAPGSTIVEWGEALAAWLDHWGRGAGLWHRFHGLEDVSITAVTDALQTSTPATQQAAWSFANQLRDTPMLQSTKERRDARAAGARWLGGTCTLSGVTLAPPSSSTHIPAHGELTFRAFARDGTTSEHRVQLAEAHWATVFPVPGYGEFLNWVTTHLPLILQAHLGWGLYQARSIGSTHRFRRLERAVEVLGWYLLALILPVFPVLVLAMLVLTVPLKFAPFESARNFAGRLQGVVSNVLGDIYILLERPSRAAAIRERVRASYEWLAQTCDRVIIVAHSQGAAIALDYLVDEKPAKVVRLLTLGSGARKLAHLRLARLGSHIYGSSGSAWVAVATPAMVGLFVYDLVQKATPSWLSLLVIAGMTLTYIVTRWLHGSDDHLQQSHEWQRLLESVKIPWNDLYARADPVSNGEHVLATRGSARPHDLHANEVQNRGSLLSDHTTYWENTSQFVPRLAAVIAKEAAFDLASLTPADDATLSYAWLAHRFRVSWLRLGRTVLWLALLHVLLQGGTHLERAGRQAIANGARLGEWLPAWVGAVVNWVLGLNFGKGREWLAGALLIMGLAAAAQYLWLKAWKITDDLATHRMFRRGANSTLIDAGLSPDLVLFVYGVVVVISTAASLFKSVPPPPVLSVETLLAMLLLVLNLKDIAICAGFGWQELRPKRRKAPQPAKP